ncbi:TPA: type IV secretion system protein TraC [Escherichia coli]|nr:type IV secretion system protein TraC [Escherichia coli]
MNNPLEAVTQAVNSLVTALKLPDESAKANEVLGEMSFPQFSRLLPYRDYNQESGLFMNDTTMGFMLEAIPINGANESIVEALDHMLRTKLPRGIPLCIHLMSSQLVGDRIEYGLREFSWSGEQAERFNAITRAYYMKAAATQFPLPEGMNLPLTLRHYMDLEKKSKTSYAKWFPSVEKEAKEWGELRQRLGSGQSSVVSYFLNITAFCKDNNETALEVEQDILNSFRKNGFELISPRFNHMRNFLTCLPFMAGKGLFKQLKEAGVVQRAESFNVANLMPLVADNPLTPAGLLAPTYRNQLAFIDIFFRGMNNTNYNMAVCGTSGAGKTGLIQPLIRSVLDSGGFAVVFDMGDGYKSLCENMGGVYLDGETLRFNPFANITDIDQSAERVRDQLSVMASPNGNLDEVHEGLLLQAVRASWLAKENRARIDDVVDFLKNASDSEQYAESPTIRSRLDEMIVLLDQYTANGTYGQYFNSDEPSLRDDAKMVVLELGGLEDRPSLLVAVMFSLIIYIENRMYRTPRNLKKLNVIDEGWRLLDFKNHKVGEFIEKGYRTARRHTGAYITITQNIVDFDSDKASSAARAAWGNSSYKIILKQSAKEFAKYNQLYPLTYWLNIITSLGCLEGGDLDIAYLSEIDPTWTDSSLTTILNPEAVIFANPIAQGACAADAIASAFNMPLDVLFWCAGSQGSMYPFNGWVSNESSPLQSSLLVSERMAFKLHRQGMIMETIGKNNAVCNEYPSPILPKERWRYQMVNMYPDSGQCHPFGRSVTRWETGKNPPNTKKNFGYLMWRKRNCVFL